MNPFLIANTCLTFGAGAWYLSQGSLYLGLLQMTFTISNILFLLMGTHKA